MLKNLLCNQQNVDGIHGTYVEIWRGYLQNNTRKCGGVQHFLTIVEKCRYSQGKI